ncbi:hypothetical protein CGK43_23730 [Vibrio parahaemolyticus]|nr:hypothetical protein CGK43_23730 [Vibrio parahaemolyticus]
MLNNFWNFLQIKVLIFLRVTREYLGCGIQIVFANITNNERIRSCVCLVTLLILFLIQTIRAITKPLAYLCQKVSPAIRLCDQVIIFLLA